MNAWDRVYSTKGMAEYPDNALIRFVAKHYYSVADRTAVTFLDIGCGGGASTWYLAREGFDVVGIDVSRVAVDRLRNRLNGEDLIASTMVTDIAEWEPTRRLYDCIVDVSSLCYLSADRIGPVMRRLHAALAPNGRMFSITPAYNCPPELFETFADGVAVKARFQTQDETAANFSMFSRAEINPYSYPASGKQARLWIIEAEK